MRILEEIGIKFQAEEAVTSFADAGCIICEDKTTVRIGRETIEQALTTVNFQIKISPRNEARKVKVGGDHVTFASVLGPPYCSDIENGRRRGTLKDYYYFISLGQYFNVIHMISSAPVEPMDIPLETHHIYSTLRALELSDKVPYLFCQSRQRIHDELSMIAIAKGTDREGFSKETSSFSIINSNSPL